MKEFIFNYVERFCDEIEPMDFYRSIFPSGILAKDDTCPIGEYHAIAIDKNTDADHKRHILVYDGLEELERLIDEKRDAVISPVSYHGIQRTDKNARFLFAIAIDLDGIESESNLREFFYQINERENIPKPTYLVCSGNGLHLYYVLETPVACYENNLKALRRYKRELTRKVWNRYVTEEYEKPQYEAVTQPMRLVGSVTKSGGIVRAFETGKKVSLEYLDSFVSAENKIGSLASSGKMPIVIAKQLYPDWYERRIVKKLPRRTWQCNRGLYDRWLERIRTEAFEGHRYFCIMALAIFAIKSGVSYEELERDALSLVPVLDSMSSEENRFTEFDVMCALEAFQDSYCTFPRETIQRLTSIELKPQRRNGRKQAEHLEIARTARDIHQRAKGTKWTDGNGRKSKYDEVQSWRKENPDGTKADCIRETGLSKPTVYKHWETEKQDTERRKAKDMILELEGKKFSNFAEFRSFLDELGEDKALDFYERNVTEINKFINELNKKK